MSSSYSCEKQNTSSLAGWDEVQDYQPQNSLNIGDFTSSTINQLPWPGPHDFDPTYTSCLTRATLPRPVQMQTAFPTAFTPPMQHPWVYNPDLMTTTNQHVARSPSPGRLNPSELMFRGRPTQAGAPTTLDHFPLHIVEDGRDSQGLGDVGVFVTAIVQDLRGSHADARSDSQIRRDALRSAPHYVLRLCAQALRDELRRRNRSTSSAVPEITGAICPFDTECIAPPGECTLKALKAHQRSHHADPSPQTCWWPVGHTYCSRNLTAPGGLLKHIGQVHLKRNTVDCPACGVPFSRSDALARHLIICTTPSPPTGTIPSTVR